MKKVLCFLGIHFRKWHQETSDGYTAQIGVCENCGNKKIDFKFL